MSDRVFLDKQAPAAFQALLATAKEIRDQARETGLDRALLELVNIRVSQLNGCAYCLDRHTRLAIEAGEEIQRLGVLPGWREADLFTRRERAALDLAEAVTLVAHQRPDDATYARAREVLSDDEISLLIWTSVTINAFNRISVLSGHPVRRRNNADVRTGTEQRRRST
ncbi:carboxymuconolactone decarboxylase family protein [Saccharopolyspora griseoalba]|uniref:Carboxymuconolactone decarboxylase family protein n=1 Tax=Saccharopolyspora griseoalba TaxID=1431848 RepID=A0ABW2LSQ0_9PSEU